MEGSKYKPEQRKSPGSPDSPVMFDTPQEALKEQQRRIMILGPVEYLYKGLALRMAAEDVLFLRDRGLDDARFSAHLAYAEKIDVYEDPEGYHVSVPEALEIPVLRAELGTTTQRPQPLWLPRLREDIAKLRRFGVNLSKIVADKAGRGVALSDSNLDKVTPMPAIDPPGDLDVLRKIVQDRKALMETEEG